MQELEDLCEFQANQGCILRPCLDDSDGDDDGGDGDIIIICPSTGERQGQKVGVGRGMGGRVWGTFGIALEM
jgi:hypothetical protein